MKTKLLLLLTFTFLTFSVSSQTTVTDPAFENYLETHDAAGLPVALGSPNSLGDGMAGNSEVTTSKIDTLTTLGLFNLGIEDLTGLEDFAALETFDFFGNAVGLTDVDLSINMNLKTLKISGFPNLNILNTANLSALEDVLLSGSNVISSLNFTTNTGLKKLSVQGFSSLINLNVASLPSLTDLAVGNASAMSSLDFSSLTALNFLNVSNNSQLSSLNIKTGNTASINAMQLQNNAILNCVLVDAGIPANGISGWNVSSSIVFDENCSQQLTFVPDDNFEAFLEANAMGNGIANDDKVFTSNIDTVTNLDVSNQAISDLTGIKDFVALVELNASSNSIVTADVTKSMNLEKLFLNNNNLVSVDTKQNTLLKQLWIRDNNFSTLDVSSNSALEWLVCSRNLIENLDLSKNTSLAFLELHTNDLRTLNLKNISNATISTFDAQLNPNLSCIQVDDVAYWNSNFGSQIDSQTSFSLNCNYPTTNVPDAFFENYLETHDRNGNTVNLGDLASMGNGIANDQKVFTHRINTVKLLNVSNIGLSNLVGLEDFRDLENFGAFGGNSGLTSADLSNNLKLERITFSLNSNATSITFGNLPNVTYLQLGFNNIATVDISGLTNLEEFKEFDGKFTMLDTSANTQLKILAIQGGAVANLDLSTNVNLENISITGTQLTSLNLSNNLKLKSVGLNNNQLSSLNIKNGANQLINTTSFSVTNNPNLTCIEVSDANYTTTSWTSIDSQHRFSTNCSLAQTFVPDNDFENYLETHDANGNTVALGDATSMGNGIANDDYVFTNRINTVTKLDIQSPFTIADFTGLEDFRDLEIFGYLFGNVFSTIDFSSNLKMKRITLGLNSALSTVTFGNLPDLEYIQLGSDLITNVDLSGLPKLEEFKSLNGKLTSLNTSGNPNLKILTLANNLITSLDLSTNVLLERLNATNNKLFNLNLKNGANNLIITANLDIKNNTNLTCVDVSNVNYAITNWTNIDSQHRFSTNCSFAQTFVPDNNFENYLETHDASGNVVALGDATSMGNGIANDDYVFTNSINTVSILRVNNLSISDMTGIQDFTSLQVLDATTNNINTLDVTSLLSLFQLAIGFNPIINIDVSQNSNLRILEVVNTGLVNLDVTSNSVLEFLKIDNTPLTTVDTSQNSGLKTYSAEVVPLTQVNLANNTALEYLELRDNNLTALNISNNLLLQTFILTGSPIAGLDLSQHTKLIELRLNNNASLNQLSIINGFNANIPTSNFDISNNPNLTCIEVSDVPYANTNWTSKDPQHVYNTTCGSQQITLTPDPNFEQKLIALNIDTDGVVNGQVFTADINTLIDLDVHSSNISDLAGIEDFTALERLHAPSNTISSIDLTNNTNLKYIHLSGNQINTINLNNNIGLEIIFLVANQLTMLNVDNNLQLKELYIDSNQLSAIDITNNTLLETLWLSLNSITAINLSQNTNLENLTLAFNQISSVNLRGLTNLKKLLIHKNNLTSLDLSDNTQLERLDISFNSIKNLDVSKHSSLNSLNVFDNNLESLDIRNGNNAIITVFDARLNSNLECIAVSDVNFFNTNFGQNSFTIDTQTSYNTDCSTVWSVMTNPATTSALLAITPSIDTNNDGEITLAEASAFTGPLDLSGQNLTDVAGLQAFENVTVIDLQNNNIADFSPLTDAMISIIQKSSGKTTYQARNGAFKLEELYISNNTAIQSLDISKLTNIKKLVIKDNPNLVTVNIKNGANASITEFNSTNTPNLTCIIVDDINAGYLANFTKDPKNNFAADEADCRARVLSVENLDISENVSFYPNPVKNILKIELSNNLQLEKTEVFTLIGKKIMDSSDAQINFSGISKGIYLIKIKTNKGFITKKIIKN